MSDEFVVKGQGLKGKGKRPRRKGLRRRRKGEGARRKVETRRWQAGKQKAVDAARLAFKAFGERGLLT